MGKRLRTQRRGRGGMNYRSPSFRHLSPGKLPQMRQGSGRIIDIVHAPGRTTPLMLIDFNGVKEYTIAPEGCHVEQTIEVGPGSSLERGNVLPIGQIPEGTLIYNLEIHPGDRGKLVRSAGAAASIISHGDVTTVQLPSGELKRINNQCYAMIGVPAGGGRIDRPLAKAGKKYHTFKRRAKAYIHVSGVAMNPVNHPFGGGSHQHVGRPSTIGRGARPGQKVGRLAPKRRRER
ncbi:MAG: 50S ribosomal protein L2 [Methanomassiliicoccales archaeon]